MTVISAAAPTASLHGHLEEYFETKTACDVDGTMAYFSPDLASYIDATLGWDIDSHAALRAIFEQYMPGWGHPARSYATQIDANATSALVHMTDTPELFGGELRALAAVDLVDGKIVRWVDYWDGATFDAVLYEQLRTPVEHFPTDLKDCEVATQADAAVVAAATALHQAFASADPAAAGALLHADVVFEDMALRTQVVGLLETTRYLGRILGQVPYGHASVLRHVVGGRHGGGFEWTAGGGLVGITALELDADGLVTKVTSVYDSRQLDPAHKVALVCASIAP